MRASIAALLSLLATPVLAQQNAQPLKATLAGHALVPAATTARAPADAPTSLRVSGKYTDPARPGRRIDALGVLEGTSFLSAKEAPRRTGHKLPIEGQPVQGFSDIKSLGGGLFLC
jgi:hypothetical protein